MFIAVATQESGFATGFLGVGLDDAAALQQSSGTGPSVLDVLMTNGIMSTKAYSLNLGEMGSSYCLMPFASEADFCD